MRSRTGGCGQGWLRLHEPGFLFLDTLTSYQLVGGVGAASRPGPENMPCGSKLPPPPFLLGLEEKAVMAGRDPGGMGGEASGQLKSIGLWMTHNRLWWRYEWILVFCFVSSSFLTLLPTPPHPTLALWQPTIYSLYQQAFIILNLFGFFLLYT